MQEVTIIIPNYNGKSLLENCFRTLENQSYKDFKVLVVDNGSTDGSTDIKSDVLDVEWIALNENLGFCGAVNLAVQKTRTPYVILLNNDTETDKYFVEWLLRGIKKSDHIFSCGAQMIDYKNHEILDNAGDLYTAMGWAVARGKGRPCKDYETSKRVFSCCAGAAIYRMDIMRKIGGLDEKHFAYLEDVDLGYRARIAGFENWYIPEAKVYQLALNVPFIFIGMFIKTLFFVRKGFGEDYCKGILEGIYDCKKCWKVKFRIKNLSNYFKIQLELWCNLVRII